MLAVLAYYLMHLAPAHKLRDHIVVDDIKKYFTPGKVQAADLQSQRDVGERQERWIDSIDNAKYQLNAVGYNLVTHKLPDGKSSEPAQRMRGGKRAKTSSPRTAPKASSITRRRG
jgi:hypothetical protein